ncbi:cell number regulator 8 [Dioscorea cayenensis subsp. rotundata]|uniref:Cell number regulator 8 n=1 Tax=Dioscorea cayennensis subsp. rotundata TaxID=55577 RepID=A0AB40C1U6_DIOCR|nr:cell number regulator 8 [Dioscorea cayenensis subsp. rotundata]
MAMANHEEEARPLLSGTPAVADEKLPKPTPPVAASAPLVKANPAPWTADGLPVSHGSVIGEPAARAQWDSSLFACLGRNDEFCSSDLEVCLLGSFAPCVLYGSNAERLGGGPGSFANNCLPYTGLYMLGNMFFGWNCLAPWFSYPRRTALRRKFNLEGSCEAFSRSFGCCHGMLQDEVRREQLESACDLATHLLCHPCSLCQEGRELRRRMPHPGFNGRPILVMMPPTEQAMGRGA